MGKLVDLLQAVSESWCLTTLADNIQVFASVEDLVCDPLQEDGDALTADGVVLLPIRIIIVLL